MWNNVGYNPLEIYLGWFNGKEAVKLDYPQINNRIIVFTHLSRVAIALAYKILRLQPGDEILVPSYNCGSEIDPLIWYGAKVIFYRINSNTMIEQEDLQSRITPKTRAVYVTHYFGWPQDLSELTTLCREKDLFLIEDCALSPLSTGPNGPVGQSGDAAIHCFWKVIPLADGGALSISKNIYFVPEKMKPPEISTILKNINPFIWSWIRQHRIYKDIRYIYRKVNKGNYTLSTIIENKYPPIPSNYYYHQKYQNRSMSRLSRGMLATSDINKIIIARRNNYKLLYNLVMEVNGIQVLFPDLPDGVCPLVFPVLVANRYQWKHSLMQQGIYVNCWWHGYHSKFSWEGFSDAIKLKNNLLVFHIDQYKDEDYICDLAAKIRKVSLKI